VEEQELVRIDAIVPPLISKKRLDWHATFVLNLLDVVSDLEVYIFAEEEWKI
jgi:hypothetical protein